MPPAIPYYNWNATHDIQQSTIPESALIGRAFVLFWPLRHWTWLNIPSGWNAVPS